MAILDGSWGMLFCRDKQKDTLQETLKNAIEYFTKKYGTIPTYIECSNKDSDEKSFRFDGIEVVAQKFYTSGNVWIRLDGYVK